MTSRAALSALAFAVLLGGCDAGITEPSSRHLRDLSFSAAFACGIDADGHAVCWGSDNGSGQLGTGDNAPHETPEPVLTGARFSQVTTGTAHTCALATDGRAFCWGSNTRDQLGVVDVDLACELLLDNGWVQDFGNDCSTVPVPVTTTLRFSHLDAAADYTCGLTSGGALWCWGAGLLGDTAFTTESATPVRVAIIGGVRTFAVGANHSCAAGTDGLGWCWGYNGGGALGLGVEGSTTSYSAIPLRINSSASLKGIAIGDEHTCAVNSAGAALCWGRGDAGQRGDSSVVSTSHDPVLVKTPVNFSTVAATENATCGLQSGSGAAWCWGENSGGQLGDGTTFDRLAPAAVLGGLSFSRLQMKSSGFGAPSTTCAVSADEVFCWGLFPQPLTFDE